MRKVITPGNSILLMLLLIIAGAIFLIYSFASRDTLVIIAVKGNAVYREPLAEDRKVTVNATLGDVRMQIKDKKVAVVYSECPDKICVRTGWRSHAGDSIVCVPNELVIHILNQ